MCCVVSHPFFCQIGSMVWLVVFRLSGLSSEICHLSVTYVNDFFVR